MSRDVPRPCAAADLIDVTPGHDASWGPPLADDPTPWEEVGYKHGFKCVFTVRDDGDWDRFAADPVLKWARRGEEEELSLGDRLVSRQGEPDPAKAMEPLRYVLVPSAGEWELRLGLADRSALDSGMGGRHGFMFSRSEAMAADDAGMGVRAGWLYAVAHDHVSVQDPSPSVERESRAKGIGEEGSLRRRAAAGDPDAASSLGLVLAAQGEMSHAEQWVRQAVAADEPHAAWLLGMILVARGKLDEAEKWFREALPRDLGAAPSLGSLLLARGKTAQAEDIFREALRRHYFEAEEVLRWLELASTEPIPRGGASPRRLRRWLRRLRSVDEPEARARRSELAKVEQEKRDSAEEQREIERSRPPPSEEFRDHLMTLPALRDLGTLAALQGRGSEAEKWFREAADYGDWAAAMDLGMLLAARGDTDEAQSWFQRILAYVDHRRRA